MKAYRITWDRSRKDRNRTSADLGYRYHLPKLECRVCTRTGSWGNGAFEYPAYKFDFLNETDFNFHRVVNLDEFEKLRKRIETTANRPTNFVPGGSIGELSGKAFSSKLENFVWGRIGLPQISRRAVDALRAEGINLFTTECNIQFRGRKLDSHLAIQVEIVPMMTEESVREHEIFHCPRCNGFDVPPMVGSLVPHGYMLRRSAWPKGEHLVKMRETARVIASEEFIQAVEKHNLARIVFEECGQWV